jgi:hypothetical protein
MIDITCIKCGGITKVDKPENSGDDSTYICESCSSKDNAKAVEKEKKINAKLSALVAQGKPYILADVVKEVESELSN